MSEGAQEVQGQPQSQPSGEMIAGKFKAVEEFEKGFSNLATEVGIPPPKKLFGKDGSYEDLPAAVAAYKALESVHGKVKSKPQEPKAEPKQPTPGDIKIPDSPPPTPDSVDAILAKAGLTSNELTNEWLSKGQLTADQYAKLATAGYPKAIVDAYFEGQKAVASTIVGTWQKSYDEAAKEVGGDDKAKWLVQNARSFVDESEIARLNASLKDPQAVRGAIRELQYLHSKKYGTAGGSIQDGTGGGAGSVTGATSHKELKEIMAGVKRGDKTAIARLAKTDMSKI